MVHTVHGTRAAAAPPLATDLIPFLGQVIVGAQGLLETFLCSLVCWFSSSLLATPAWLWRAPPSGTASFLDPACPSPGTWSLPSPVQSLSPPPFLSFHSPFSPSLASSGSFPLPLPCSTTTPFPYSVLWRAAQHCAFRSPSDHTWWKVAPAGSGCSLVASPASTRPPT